MIPVAWLTAFVFFCVLFRVPISALLSRVTGIGTSGITAQSPQQTAIEQQVGAEQQAALQKALDTTSAYLREQEAAIVELLKDAKIETPADQIAYLTRYAALLKILGDFGELYLMIFGSQILTLNEANASPGGIPTPRLNEIYTEATKRNPTFYATYTFEQWTDFMMRNQLLAQDGESFQITLKAKEFLAFLIHTGRNLLKPN